MELTAICQKDENGKSELFFALHFKWRLDCNVPFTTLPNQIFQSLLDLINLDDMLPTRFVNSIIIPRSDAVNDLQVVMFVTYCYVVIAKK